MKTCSIAITVCKFLCRPTNLLKQAYQQVQEFAGLYKKTHRSICIHIEVNESLMLTDNLYSNDVKSNIYFFMYFHELLIIFETMSTLWISQHIKPKGMSYF